MSSKPEIESPAAGQTDNVAKKQFRGSSLLLAGRFVAIGVNFAFQVLVVRYLTKSDYGAFAYALSLVALGSSFVRFGMEKPLSRFVPIFQEQRDYARMAGAILVVLATIAALGMSLVLVVFGLQGVLARNLVSNPLSMMMLLTLIFLAPTRALENVLEKMFAIFARPRALFFRRHILGPGLKICAVIPLIFFHSNIYVFAICYLIGGVLQCLQGGGVGRFVCQVTDRLLNGLNSTAVLTAIDQGHRLFDPFPSTTVVYPDPFKGTVQPIQDISW